MRQDIDRLLRAWAYKHGSVQARLVSAGEGREVIQMRVDLGLFQMETAGRPDGSRPGGFETAFEQFVNEADAARRKGEAFTLSEEQCEEADREFAQFYHRRLCWLALQRFADAISDADHTLAFMDFVRDHAPSEDYVSAHEQYRGFVTFHRTQASAALAVERENPEAAIDEVLAGLARLQAFFSSHGADEEPERNGMIRHLRQLERSLRKAHGIRATLRERLEEAVAREEYETAAKLRDALRRRG